MTSFLLYKKHKEEEIVCVNEKNTTTKTKKKKENIKGFSRDCNENRLEPYAFIYKYIRR